MNPEKTDSGLLILTHACSPQTAADEFMINRQEYIFNTGREQTNEVLGYHVRQAFKPEEITPQEANGIIRHRVRSSTAVIFKYMRL